MELPRGCQYWNNEEVRFMVEGTESTIHDFDGCCYKGLANPPMECGWYTIGIK